MKKTIYKSETRGHQQHGWLDARHTFSFANYYDPNRIHFGVLRVLNDDIIEGGKGFGTHPHDNMEIITIPLSGALQHKDSMGYSGIIRPGEVQVMSAGKGIKHSEFNALPDEDLNLFQIWIFPNEQEVEPRYDQKDFKLFSHKGVLQEVVSPDRSGDALWIHQNSWFSVGEFDKGSEFTYKIKANDNGVFAMIIDGEFEIAQTVLDRRDGIGIWDTDSFTVKSLSDNSRILLMDVPMHN